MRYEIQVGSSSTADVSGVRSRFQKVKSVVLAFVALCAIVGVLIAAFVVGTVLAGLILLGLVAVVCAWAVARMFRRRE